MGNKQPLHPDWILTVVLRNDGPMVFVGDSPTFRTVHLELTDKQHEAIALRWIGKNCGFDMHETVSTCFLERRNDESEASDES